MLSVRDFYFTAGLTDAGAVGHYLLGRDEAHLAVSLLGHEDHALGLDAADFVY